MAKILIPVVLSPVDKKKLDKQQFALTIQKEGCLYNSYKKRVGRQSRIGEGGERRDSAETRAAVGGSAV